MMREEATHLLLQIVYPNGEVYQMPAGGALEMNLEEQLAGRVAIKIAGYEGMLAEALTAKGVGFFHTSAQVESALRQSFRETIKIETTVREAFKEVMFEFKDQVKHP